jgi:hypothetical protein
MEVSLGNGKDSQSGIYFTGVFCGGLFKTLCPSQAHIAKQISYRLHFHFLAFLEKINTFFINSCIFRGAVVE